LEDFSKAGCPAKLTSYERFYWHWKCDGLLFHILISKRGAVNAALRICSGQHPGPGLGPAAQ
jgi:hypothetical protein